jgi:hypothetical protein
VLACTRHGESYSRWRLVPIPRRPNASSSPQAFRRLLLWLDRARIRFRFFGHCQTYTGGFSVFGPVLSSPAHAAPSLDMPPI